MKFVEIIISAYGRDGGMFTGPLSTMWSPSDDLVSMFTEYSKMNPAGTFDVIMDGMNLMAVLEDG